MSLAGAVCQLEKHGHLTAVRRLPARVLSGDFACHRRTLRGHGSFVTIARVAGSIRFPSDVLLVVAMNPCPCGFAGHATIACQCDERALTRYRRRLSGPLADRIDLHVPVGAVPLTALDTDARPAESPAIRAQVTEARRLQWERFGALNATVSNRRLAATGHFQPEALTLLRTASERLGLSARAWHRTLRIARTIADLSEQSTVSATAVAEALRFRRTGGPAPAPAAPAMSSRTTTGEGALVTSRGSA